MKPIQNLPDLEVLCRQVCDLARETGAFIRQEVDQLHHTQVETKSLHNFVTYVDKTAEEMLVSRLQILLPGAGFIAEENTIEKEDHEYQWIVDPLDGTTNFIHGIPVFSISIALMKERDILLGVVYEINQNECFWAVKGKGAFLNGEPISVTQAPTIHHSLLATGFPYYDYSRLEKYMKLFTWCLRNSHGVRRLGSAAVDLVYVACGRFDGFFEYSLSPWDVAAGALIVREAGGKVSDFSGGDNPVFGREIIATNALIFDELLEKVQEAFK